MKAFPKLSAAIYGAVALLLTIHCYRTPLYDIDLLSYTGNVALSDTTDLRAVHRAVYSDPLTPHLRGFDASDRQAMILRHRAADPYFSALYLPYFSVKPLYVLALEAAHKLGATLVGSSRIISALFFFGIALVVWLYSRSLIALVALLVPQILALGESNTPDGMSVFLLLLGLWMIFVLKKEIGLLTLILSVWVRPDNFVVCLIVLSVLYWNGRLSKLDMTVVGFLVVGSVAVISHYGYGSQSLYAHSFLGSEPGAEAHFGISDYLHALAKGLKDIGHGPLIGFSILWAVSFAAVSKEMRQILAIAAASSVVRFVIFPSYEERFFALFFLTTAMAGIAVIRQAMSKPQVTRSVAHHP